MAQLGEYYTTQAEIHEAEGRLERAQYCLEVNSNAEMWPVLFIQRCERDISNAFYRVKRLLLR